MNWPMHMDKPHIDMIVERASRGDLHAVVEVGCHKGVSTAPLVRLLREGLIESLWLYDIAPTPELHELVDDVPGVYLETRHYWEKPTWGDMVIIDGDHRWPALADLATALAWRATVIVLHDSMAKEKAGLDDCWGAGLAADILRRAPYRKTVEDYAKRDGYYTQRGILISEVTQ